MIAPLPTMMHIDGVSYAVFIKDAGRSVVVRDGATDARYKATRDPATGAVSPTSPDFPAAVRARIEARGA